MTRVEEGLWGLGAGEVGVEESDESVGGEWSFFFFKQETAYEVSAWLVGSEMCIRGK